MIYPRFRLKHARVKRTLNFAFSGLRQPQWPGTHANLLASEYLLYAKNHVDSTIRCSLENAYTARDAFHAPECGYRDAASGETNATDPPCILVRSLKKQKRWPHSYDNG